MHGSYKLILRAMLFRHVDHSYSHALELSEPIRFITLFFIFLIMWKFYVFPTIPFKLEYASIARNNFTSTDSNKLNNIRRKFLNLCYCRFVEASFHRSYEPVLNYLNYAIHLYDLFIANVFGNKISCFSITEQVRRIFCLCL
jgi:hypothetical protein